ncbi:MAG: proton-conducting transporter membrane subunit [Chromatiales bacterium]|jgi:NADH-quinone oxidoreductase subunit M
MQFSSLNPLDLLLLVSAATVVIAILIGSMHKAGLLLTLIYAGMLFVLLQFDVGTVTASSLSIHVFGQALHWQFDSLAWFFAIISIGAAWLASWYTAGEWADGFVESGGNLRALHVGLAVNVLAMLLLLASGDLLSLFIGWELVSWSGLLLMMLGGRESSEAGHRYITYAMAGGMAVLAAVILIYNWTGSLQFGEFMTALPGLSLSQLWWLALLFSAGFAVKMGLLPFHLWQAPAYALTAGPAAAFLGSISSRMGLFAIALVVVKMIGLARLDQLVIVPQYFSLRDLLAWIAAISIVLPTFTALRQNDARLLLAWHGIGQGGYMLLGLVMMDSMGSAGGLMHVFNHATYQAALFMAVFAIVHRTGTADLNRLGGLVARMPLSFLAMLIGIIGLAGLPPMNGFVSKWLVYRALLNEGMPLLFIAAVAGTLGTILSVYKLLHNSFLGQLRIEHEHVKEAPWSMTLPMMILSVIVFVTGTMPGLVLEYIAQIQVLLGLEPLQYSMGGAQSSSGSLDMIWIGVVLLAGFGIAAVIFLSAGRSKRLHQLDNYAGGHFLTADNQYHYSNNFYAGLMHLIKPWYRGTFAWLENSLVSATGTLSWFAHGFFNQLNPLVWGLVVVTLGLAWMVF